jgi:molybdate transport system substrate-binding protein
MISARQISPLQRQPFMASLRSLRSLALLWVVTTSLFALVGVGSAFVAKAAAKTVPKTNGATPSSTASFVSGKQTGTPAASGKPNTPKTKPTETTATTLAAKTKPSQAVPATTIAKPSTSTAAITGATQITTVTPLISELLVAGASDLRPAFEEIGKLFTAQTGTKVTFSFGSSVQLAQQLTNGAPFDVFASADKTYIDEVLANGIGDAATKATYAFGRLALWVPATTQKRFFNVLDLSDPSIQRIAIANPEHAPYGVAAKQALQSAKIYELLADKLVYGENVSDTYRLATSGNADAALVSLSLVIANRNGGRYLIVPTDAHAPLEQALVVTAKRQRASSAKAFVSLVTGTSGRSVMRKFGFLLPGDPKPLNDNG